MKLEVKVTRSHIKCGIPQKCRYCPVALAMMNISGVEFPQVFSDRIIFLYKRKSMNADLPRDARDFVVAFDSLDLVSPIAFTLDCEPV